MVAKQEEAQSEDGSVEADAPGRDPEMATRAVEALIAVCMGGVLTLAFLKPLSADTRISAWLFAFALPDLVFVVITNPGNLAGRTDRSPVLRFARSWALTWGAAAALYGVFWILRDLHPPAAYLFGATTMVLGLVVIVAGREPRKGH